MSDVSSVLREPAEVRFAAELARLAKADEGRKPPGWNLSPRSVRTFLLGGERPAVSRKFHGDDALVDRAIVTLMSNRGLLLVGEPGTAKSMLSELLAAAISGTSLLTIQGSAGTTEDQIHYSWNYALLLAEGPTPGALVPGPLHQGIQEGRLVRFEEITRCPAEIQDSMISVLSDKVLHLPELRGDDTAVFARPGFNVIATANTRDRGVNEMSAALKRRFNFETVHPIADPAFEIELVRTQAGELLREAGVDATLDLDVVEVLVTTFADLRRGRTEEGTAVERPSTVLSTAEAVAVAFSAGLDAFYFGDGTVAGDHIAKQIVGTVLKDSTQDAKKVRHYFDVVVKSRRRRSRQWKAFWEARVYSANRERESDTAMSSRGNGPDPLMPEATDVRDRVGAVLASLRSPDVTYFPIRHHSPACARQLERWIDEHGPSVILVEAPESAGALIQLLLDESCVPPVAFFSRFVDRSGHLEKAASLEASENAADQQGDAEAPSGTGPSGPDFVPRFAAYSPFCETSPEWVALRAGQRIGARLRFIDLDFADQVLARTHAKARLRSTDRGGVLVDLPAAEDDPDARIESLTADPHLRHGEFLAELGQRLGCRDADELWDHLFEAAQDLEVDTFIDRVGAYCALARFSWTEEVLAADATLAREQHMAAAIREELDQRHNREDDGPVLVVSGGFHSVALPGLVAGAPEPQRRPRFRDDEIGTWLVPYSFDRLDALGGYASGMPSPAFYDRLARARGPDGEAGEDPADSAADLLVEIARRTRELELPTAVSTADAIAAVVHMEGVATLRGHRIPQREDLLDAVRSVYVKGEMGTEGEVLFAVVRAILAGDRVGQVPPGAGRPPLVDDFREEVRRLRLPLDTIEAKDVDLDLYRRRRDREISHLLHCLDLLEVPYASFLRGPDFVRGRDLDRRIETWRVTWSPNVEGALLEAADLGPSVADAATTRLQEQVEQLTARAQRSAGAGARLLLRALRLGLHDRLPQLLPVLQDLVDEDGDLVSVAACLDALDLVTRMVGPLEASGLHAVPALIHSTWRRACHLVEDAASCGEDAVEGIVEAFVSLREQLAHAVSSVPEEGEPALDPELLVASLERLLNAPADSVHGALAGAAAGLLFSLSRLDEASLGKEIRGRLANAAVDPARACAVLRGLLLTAREVSWQVDEVVRSLDGLLDGWSEEDFLRALPQLRLAFTGLTPREIVRVADRVAAGHDGRSVGSLVHHDLEESDVLIGLELSRRVEEILVRDGLPGTIEPDASRSEDIVP